MKTTTELVTPDMAKAWLNRNTANRNISPLLVSKYARVMAENQWSLTHQGIAIYEDGTLADGQHRLSAVVSSGCSVMMQVTYGVLREAGGDIDMHRARDMGDAIRIAGFADWIGKDAIAISRIAVEKGSILSMRDIVAVCTKHEAHYKMVSSSFSTKRRGVTSSPIMAAVVVASVAGEEKNRLQRFASCMISGIPESQDDIAAIRLREHAISSRSALGGAVGRNDLFLRSQRAIKAFCDNERISRLLLPSSVIYPYLKVQHEH